VSLEGFAEVKNGRPEAADPPKSAIVTVFDMCKALGGEWYQAQ